MVPHEVAFTVSSISVTAIGGAGGDTKGAVDTRAEQTNTGGTAEAYGIFNTDSAVKASVTGDITVTATGGAAGNGGNASDDNYDGTIVARNGLDGAVGTASGVRNINGYSVIEATNLKQTAVQAELAATAAGLIKVLFMPMAPMAEMAALPMPMACKAVAAQQNLLSIK